MVSLSRCCLPVSRKKGFSILTHLLIPTGPSQLEWIGDAAYLFLEDEQSLSVLNAEAAQAWPQFQTGVLCKDDTPCDASICTPSVVASLKSIGAIEPLSSQEGAVPIKETLLVDTGVSKVLIGFDSNIPDSVMAAFSHMATPASPTCDAYVLVQRLSDKTGVASQGEPPVPVGDDMLVPQLKLTITEAILDHADQLLLHAAIAVHDSGHAMLLVGGPGAGKSTLATALDTAGFTLAGDDVAVLKYDGSVFAIPFPSTLKTGAWELLDAKQDEISEANTHLRPDGQYVRYLTVDAETALTPRPVSWIVFLDRQNDEAPTLSPQPVPQTISGLISQAWSGTSDLTTEEFGALAACVNDASCFQLRYSDLKKAVAALRDFCTEPVRDI